MAMQVQELAKFRAFKEQTNQVYRCNLKKEQGIPKLFQKVKDFAKLDLASSGTNATETALWMQLRPSGS
jgi:putative protein kinase ArgK-like GTPase of G3E family